MSAADECRARIRALEEENAELREQIGRALEWCTHYDADPGHGARKPVPLVALIRCVRRALAPSDQSVAQEAVSNGGD